MMGRSIDTTLEDSPKTEIDYLNNQWQYYGCYKVQEEEKNN